MKKIKIERIKNLFDHDLCRFMLSCVEDKGQCHKNAVLMCACLNRIEKKVKYVEGYLDIFGHCINSFERNGVTHYFDISQEWLIENGKKPQEKFIGELNVVYEQFGNVVLSRVLREHMSRLYKVEQFIFYDRRFCNIA